MGKVIYLTGAPASGKSSTAALLAQAMPDLLVWEYGSRLTEHVRKRSAEINSQSELRAKSGQVTTPDDINQVDEALISFVKTQREENNIIIDSHPVTKEAYGFRITAFSHDRIQRLRPDEVWVLYANPAVTLNRIANDPAGRPMITEEEARTHSALQASVAATYGIALGCPVYLFDTSGNRDDLVARLSARLQ